MLYEVITAQDDGDAPVNLVVASDESTVMDNLQSVVDSFNDLIESLKELYDDGGDP